MNLGWEFVEKFILKAFSYIKFSPNFRDMMNRESGKNETFEGICRIYRRGRNKELKQNNLGMKSEENSFDRMKSRAEIKQIQQFQQ